jgi:hypothetical protein
VLPEGLIELRHGHETNAMSLLSDDVLPA